MLRRRCAVKRVWGAVPVALLFASRRCGWSGGGAEFPDDFKIPDFKKKNDNTSRTTALVTLFREYKLPPDYVSEVERATTYADAAKWGLLLGAAAFRHQVHHLALPLVVPDTIAADSSGEGPSPPTKAPERSEPKGTLAKRFAAVADCPLRNATYAALAIDRGIFDFADFVPLQALTIIEWINRQVAFNNAVHVLRCQSDNLFSRHIPVDGAKHVTHHEIVSAIESRRLPIVCGPSGSGKTATTLFTLSSYPCIYLVLTEAIRNNDAALGKEKEPERNAKVVTQLIDMIEPLLKGYVSKRCTGEVVLIVDELGETPNFLRALCALYKPTPSKDASAEDLAANAARESEWQRLTWV